MKDWFIGARRRIGAIFGAARKGEEIPLYELGFHGDRYLLAVVEELLQNSAVFVETGTRIGTTLRWVGTNFPNVKCYSCEPEEGAFKKARANTAHLKNVVIFNMGSEEMLPHVIDEGLLPKSEPCVFWLDAHGYGFRWPLRFEVEYIAEQFQCAYVLIDDFKVPGSPEFGYDRYAGQECSLDFIRPALPAKKSYGVYYPAYTEKTSGHHPLRGWCLITVGHEEPRILSVPARSLLRVAQDVESE